MRMNGLKNKSDGDLVKMTLSGNNKAFEELVIRYENKAKGTAYKVTGNKFLAEDASQDAFVCAWIRLDRLKDAEKFSSWLCAIAKNRAVDLMRNYRNSLSNVSFELLENIDLDGKNAVISEFLEQSRNDILHETVESLSEKIRETVKLHYFEGMSTEEIAKRQNISVGTVKWRLSEGRRVLRKEYGVMENNSNTTFVQQVMHQVEQLKLWSLKDDKTGFEKEYSQVLKNIVSLQESTQKQYMLADVLARGYWWLEIESNDEMFNRIKSAAEEGLNEDIMKFVISKEWIECKDGDKIGYMENVQLPQLIQNEFKDALGYFYFWLAYECCNQGQPEKGIRYYKKVLETLNKSDAFYAAASGAVHIEERKLSEGITPHFIGAKGTVLEYKDNKLYFMQEPGYNIGDPMSDAIFFNSVYCDNLMFDSESLTIYYNSDSYDRIMFDSSLEESESLISSDGKRKLTCKGKNERVKTLSGIYENCICYVSEGEYCGTKYCETYFCQGVGIVRQVIGQNGEEWQLSKCRIKAGDEIIPFAEGNLWEYCLVRETDKNYDAENVFEIVYSGEGKAVFKQYTYVKVI